MGLVAVSAASWLPQARHRLLQRVSSVHSSPNPRFTPVGPRAPPPPHLLLLTGPAPHSHLVATAQVSALCRPAVPSLAICLPPLDRGRSAMPAAPCTRSSYVSQHHADGPTRRLAVPHILWRRELRAVSGTGVLDAITGGAMVGKGRKRLCNVMCGRWLCVIRGA